MSSTNTATAPPSDSRREKGPKAALRVRTKTVPACSWSPPCPDTTAGNVKKSTRRMNVDQTAVYNSVACWNLRQQLHQLIEEHVPHGDCARRQIKWERDIRLLLVPNADRSRGPRLRMYAQPEGRRQTLDGKPSAVYLHGGGSRWIGREQPEGNGARAEPYIRDLKGDGTG
ncbi:unnamed protein product [Ectocarpus sp. 12 AP-2014]